MFAPSLLYVLGAPVRESLENVRRSRETVSNQTLQLSRPICLSENRPLSRDTRDVTQKRSPQRDSLGPLVARFHSTAS